MMWPFYPSMILFQMVVEVLGSAMFDVIAEDLVEGRRIAGVLIGGDLVRGGSGDRHGGAEERLGGFLIAAFAQIDVNQITVAVDCPVQVAPLAGDPGVRLIDVALVQEGGKAECCPMSLIIRRRGRTPGVRGRACG